MGQKRNNKKEPIIPKELTLLWSQSVAIDTERRDKKQEAGDKSNIKRL